MVHIQYAPFLPSPIKEIDLKKYFEGLEFFLNKPHLLNVFFYTNLHKRFSALKHMFPVFIGKNIIK